MDRDCVINIHGQNSDQQLTLNFMDSDNGGQLIAKNDIYFCIVIYCDIKIIYIYKWQYTYSLLLVFL